MPLKSQKPARNRGKWGAGFGSVVDVETNYIMTYRERLYCWAIARLLPNQQWIIVGRFRSRSDAEGHFQFLQQNMPNVPFKVVFDTQTEQLRLAPAGDRI